MTEASRFVVIGAGQAGGWAAKTLRDHDADASIILIGEELHPPYERPSLSKDVLVGVKPLDSTYIFTREKLAASGVELRHAKVIAIDRTTKELVLADQNRVPYDRLLLTVGSRVKRLNVPGAELAGIHYLRTIEESIAIGRELGLNGHLMVIGGGWIGLEVASAARKRGMSVTIVECSDRLCSRMLPKGELAAYLLDLHRRNGVDVKLNETVTAFGGTSRVQYAVLSSGQELPVFAVVFGIGISPNVELAQAAHLEIDDGIVVDQYCRTSDPDIFAAGDCTNQPNDFVRRRIRLESWANAQNQAIAAAKAVTDSGTPYQEVPWFWSDQYHVNIQMLGLPNGFDRVATRCGPSRDQFLQFYLANDRIVAVAAIAVLSAQ